MVNRNSIHDNGGLGITVTGPAPNPPVLQAVTTQAGQTTITGTFSGPAGTLIELFSNMACDPSGSGEGQTFIGSANVANDMTFTAVVSAIPAGLFVTATATSRNTSQFSVCEEVPASFYTLPLCRVVDTRNPLGPFGGPSLQAGTQRSFDLGGQCGIPTTATAVAVNIAAVLPTNGPGFLTLYPGGTIRPPVATISYNAGKTRANNAVISLGNSHDLVVYCEQPTGATNLVIDVAGFFQ